MKKDCTCPLCTENNTHKLLQLLIELSDRSDQSREQRRHLEPDSE